MNKLTHWDYCQFLLVSQVNYTQTYFAEQSEHFSHDRINRLMRTAKLSPRELREMVRSEVVLSENGYILFDDTVLDKSHAFAIEVVRRQWSGNAKQVIKGIGLVTCVYVNPDTAQFWVIDYRIFDPERDGRSKLDHLLEMWQTILYVEKLPFRTVLMDSWYATMKVMKAIEKAGKIYYCPLKSNRQVNQSPDEAYQRVDALTWSQDEMQTGKLVHLKQFPNGHQLKLFRIVLSTQRTDYVVTNDLSQDSADATQDRCAIRWKIEQFHREAKQVTGLESSQCRSQRAQRNHIACAMLVWVRLNQIALQTQKTVYQIKQGLLDDYMRAQLRLPSISIRPA
ncbi:MAG: transposase [Caldilineaceae bacterium]|nr:transposase [Caldilineaceae bacterium]MBX2999494.1 transposase [Caldilineaceae bacterium]